MYKKEQNKTKQNKPDKQRKVCNGDRQHIALYAFHMTRFPLFFLADYIEQTPLIRNCL